MQPRRRAAACARKKALNLLFRKNQFDKVVDLTDKDVPTGDMLIDVAPPLKAAPP